MAAYLIAIIVIISAAVIFAAVMFALALYAVHTAFGGRFDKNKNLKYFSAEDFNLNAIPVSTHDGKTELRGYIYFYGDISAATALVIFSHGMGPGHCAYTTEIAYFCSRGYAVLAFDCAGCGLSDGRSMRGMESSTRALVAAAKFAEGDERLKNLKKFFVGHSMGAYSALCATAFYRPCGVVAFSAPERPSLMVRHGAEPVVGSPLARLLRPFVSAVARVRFGKYGDMSASRAVVHSGVPALVVHGALDKTVPPELSAYYFAQGASVERMLCEDKAHNPYNTVAAEKLLKELASAIADSAAMDEEERKSRFSAFDYAALCEEDGQVMSAAADFIQNLL